MQNIAKIKLSKQQKLNSIIRDPKFRAQFFLLDEGRYWQNLSRYLTLNILVIDKLCAEYMKDDYKTLIDKIEFLEDKLRYLEQSTRGYRIDRAERDFTIITLWEKRNSFSEIAKKVGMTRQGVKKALIRLGAI